MEEINSELTAELDEAKNTVIELEKQIGTGKAKSIVDEVASELTDTQKEKLLEMVNDSVEFIDEEKYTSAVKLLMNKFFTEENEDEEVNEDDLSAKDVRKKLYLKAITNAK